MHKRISKCNIIKQFKRVKSDKYFNKSQLKLGMKTESEHTRNKKIQKIIAKAHLQENPRYYKVLKKMRL